MNNLPQRAINIITKAEKNNVLFPTLLLTWYTWKSVFISWVKIIAIWKVCMDTQWKNVHTAEPFKQVICSFEFRVEISLHGLQCYLKFVCPASPTHTSGHTSRRHSLFCSASFKLTFCVSMNKSQNVSFYT